MKYIDRMYLEWPAFRVLDYTRLVEVQDVIDAVDCRTKREEIRAFETVSYWHICLASVFDGDVRWSNDTGAVDLIGFR